ncbi:hypothetical protein RRF57_004569 [Xylaria bambusicola]|uniref:Mid2 domain-containing protein n=1 Tax=Xylaria bambusicola TaxID=326684 RepID=A0AAN7UIB8_9PEZI
MMNRIFACQSTSSLTWESTLGCVSQNTRQQTLDVIVASDASTSLYTLDVGAIGAYSVQVRYQSTDFMSSISSSATAMTSTSVTASDTGRNTNIDGISGGTDKNDRSMGISAGAAAGIAIGTFAGGLIVTMGIWYLLRQKRRQRQRQLSQITVSGLPNIMALQQPYPTKSSAIINGPQELRDNQIHELPNNSR